VFSKVLIKYLIARDDGPWADWTGYRDKRPPHKLTQSELAGLLRELTPFIIRPRSVWLPGHEDGGKGYHEADFVPVWKAYLDEAVTPAQPSPVRQLHGI
jgi:hypothetical protein